MKKLILFVFLLISYTTIYSQIEDESKNNATESISFNFCESNLRFLDQNLVKADHVQIARWEEAFNPQPNFTLKSNFKELDEERFFLEVTDSDVSGNTIIVNLESYERGDNPLTDLAADQQIGVTLTRVGNTDDFRSGACLLVTDKDEVDDNFTGPISGLDGTDDQGDDPTLYAQCGGKLKLTYSGEEFIIDVCDQGPKEIRVVRLNIVSMRKNNGVDTYFDNTEIMTEIQRLQKSWGQCCFRFLDQNGGEIDVSDIILTNQPSGVTLDNGLETEFTTNGTTSVDLTDEEKNLIDGVKDLNPLTLDLIFIENVVDDPYGTGVFTESGSRGFAIPLYLTNSVPSVSVISEQYINTVFITKYRTYFTTPHEIGHILTNNAHYGNEYSGIQERSANLMRGGYIIGNTVISTSEFNGVGTSKRLINTQCEAARTEPTGLPQIEN